MRKMGKRHEQAKQKLHIVKHFYIKYFNLRIKYKRPTRYLISSIKL